MGVQGTVSQVSLPDLETSGMGELRNTDVYPATHENEQGLKGTRVSTAFSAMARLGEDWMLAHHRASGKPPVASVTRDQGTFVTFQTFLSLGHSPSFVHYRIFFFLH